MLPLSKKEEKLISSLKSKKFREREGLFVVEGKKLVQEALNSDFEIKLLVISIDDSIEFSKELDYRMADERQMKRISSLTTAPGILAIIEIPEPKELKQSDLILALEDVKDPGNLGTIIRTADAFGVRSIVSSPETVDYYNPKVVQASMGAIFRMQLISQVLTSLIANKADDVKVYASHLEGENIYEGKLQLPAILLLGNESRGISETLSTQVDQKLKIPIAEGAESFNVAIANAIFLAEFKRRFPL